MHSANSSVILPSAVVPPGLTSSFDTVVASSSSPPREHAGQAAADPQPRLAERVLLVAEEAVEAHRVVDFGRAEVEQVGDLADRLQRHAAQLVLDEVQRRQRHRLLAAGSAAGRRGSSARSIRLVNDTRTDSLSIQLRRDDVQAAQHRHHVADLVPYDQVREHREVDERRRPGARPVGHAAAVRHDVEAQLAVGRLDGRRTPRPPASPTGGWS